MLTTFMFSISSAFRAGIKLAIATVLITTLAGCGGSSKGSSQLNASPAVVSLYKANCVSCHGTELQGRVGPDTNLQEIGARMSASDITKQIEQGGDTMPAYKERLTAEEIAGLAAWLATKK